VAGVHIEGGRSAVWSIPGAVVVDGADGAIGADGAELKKIRANRAIRANGADTGNLARNDGAEEAS
jgi:hypothetical protein